MNCYSKMRSFVIPGITVDGVVVVVVKNLVRRDGETTLGKLNGFPFKWVALWISRFWFWLRFSIHRIRRSYLMLIFALQLLEEPQVEQAQQLRQETIARWRQSRSSSQELQEIEEVNTRMATRPLRILSHFWYYVAFWFWMFVLK